MSVIVVRKIIESFFIKELGYEKEAIQVLGINKPERGWEAKIFVTETNRYLKKLGYPPVYDKSTYSVKLDDDMEIVAYWNGELGEGED
ncbi:MAG: hypothetical protein ACOY46_15825 [Bacillota bacterium]